MRSMSTSYPLPELTGELVGQIIYAMENQREKAYFDLKEAIVTLVPSPSTVDLPQWKSADGFDLMTRFASRTRSQALKAALSQGHGVFRAFKNVLDTDPAEKQLWLSFKRHEMEKVVTAWYRRLKSESEKEEGAVMEDVLLEDFSVVFSDREPDDKALLVRIGGERPSFSGASFVSLLAPDNSLAAILVYRVEGALWHVIYYGVDAPWRGLGLFRLMFESLAKKAGKAQIQRILFDSKNESMAVGAMFQGVEGVRPVSMTLEIPTSAYLDHQSDEDEEPSPYV